MFRLIRLVVFTMVAFVAGVLYERNNTRALCAKTGSWVSGFCYNAEQP